MPKKKITKKKATEAVWESEKKFKQFFENAHPCPFLLAEILLFKTLRHPAEYFFCSTACRDRYDIPYRTSI